MSRLFYQNSHGLGKRSNEEVAVPSANHVAGELTPSLKAKIASLQLVRVAGNVYSCPSTTDFWKVQGGKVMRMAGEEVDNGDSLVAAPNDSPEAFLEEILGDLSFD